MDNETKMFVGLFLLYWLFSTIYVIKWHIKQRNLSTGTILIAILMGPILFHIVRDMMKESHKKSINTVPKIKKDFKFFRG